MSMKKTASISLFSKDVAPDTLAIAFISIIYLVGIVGLSIAPASFLVRLSPANLLLSIGLVLYFHRNWSRSTILAFTAIYLFTWTAEWLGVSTGLIFGSYQYGGVLGPKIQGTPLMIGINWLLLSYCTASFLTLIRLTRNRLLNTLLGAFILTGIDVLIEPVAMALDFWQWDLGEVPIQNYIGWFVVALPVMAIHFFAGTAENNKVALAVYILQILFFSVLTATIV